MTLDLAGRTAVVTGAGRGIGRAIALKLAAAGAALMVNDLDREPLFETVQLIDQGGGHVKALPGDITAPDFPEKLVTAAVGGFGSIDIIVNNAGYTWDSVIQTARIKGSESVIAPEAGHSTYWEQPQVFNRAVLDFIGRH